VVLPLVMWHQGRNPVPLMADTATRRRRARFGRKVRRLLIGFLLAGLSKSVRYCGYYLPPYWAARMG